MANESTPGILDQQREGIPSGMAPAEQPPGGEAGAAPLPATAEARRDVAFDEDEGGRRLAGPAGASGPAIRRADSGEMSAGPPHSLEAEQAVLGSVLIDPEAYFAVAAFLKPEDFYLIRHQWIWDAYVKLHEQRMPVDFVTVTEELERRGQLAEMGGPAYLTRLMNAVPTSIHAEAYGRIVEQTAVRRRLLNAAAAIAKLAYQEERIIEEVVNDSEQALFHVIERRLTHDVRPIRAVASEYFDYVQELYDNRDQPLGVPTGFNALDQILGGMQKSDLLIIAGRPSQGKSGFLFSVALNAARRYKKRVAIFSLEMSNEQVLQRLVSQETKIDSQKLRLGRLDGDDWPLFVEAINALSEAPIFLDDTPAITPLQLRTKCRRLYLEHGLDLIIVDYLQLMTSEVRNENRVQEVSYVSRSLKTLARELRVPVLTAAQLSRAVEQRHGQRPMLSDLRESGSLEQDSDVVMFIHPSSDVLKPNVSEIIVAKHRNGPTGTAELYFNKTLAQFWDAETRPDVLEQLR